MCVITRPATDYLFMVTNCWDWLVWVRNTICLFMKCSIKLVELNNQWVWHVKWRSKLISQTWVFHEGHIRGGSRGCGTFWESACPRHACDVVKASENERIWSCRCSGDCCQGSHHDGSDRDQKRTCVSITLLSSVCNIWILQWNYGSPAQSFMLKCTHTDRDSVVRPHLSKAAVLLPQSW